VPDKRRIRKLMFPAFDGVARHSEGPYLGDVGPRAASAN